VVLRARRGAEMSPSFFPREVLPMTEEKFATKQAEMGGLTQGINHEG